MENTISLRVPPPDEPLRSALRKSQSSPTSGRQSKLAFSEEEERSTERHPTFMEPDEADRKTSMTSETSNTSSEVRRARQKTMNYRKASIAPLSFRKKSIIAFESNRKQSVYQVLVSKPKSTPCAMGCSSWCKKYFWEGQSLDKSIEEAKVMLSDDDPWYKVALVKYRRPIALILPGTVFHIFWWAYAIKFNLFRFFVEKYPLSITMIIGSMIAGMTSEGGGAVAYPVMTLALNAAPSVARDVSMLIQSCGMSCASFSIFFMRVHLEWFALTFCTLGGMVGMIFGLHLVDPNLPGSYKKMAFVCIFFTFAFALFLLNRYRNRKTYKAIPDFRPWKAIVLLFTGFVGGVFTSFSGSGLDICSFSVLTLLFRVSEKIATPTSVILMAANSLIGIYWRDVMLGGISQEAWEYIAVTAPIVTIGAPLGSVVGTHFHRQVLAGTIYVLDTASLIAAFLLVPQTPMLIGISVGIIVFGFLFFLFITKLGERIMAAVEGDDDDADEDVDYDSDVTDDSDAEVLPAVSVSVKPTVDAAGFTVPAVTHQECEVRENGTPHKPSVVILSEGHVDYMGQQEHLSKVEAPPSHTDATEDDVHSSSDTDASEDDVHSYNINPAFADEDEAIKTHL